MPPDFRACARLARRGIAFAQVALATERNGLAALAESFALDRAELYRLKLLNQHLFEHLCKELTLLGATAVNVVELSLRVEDYPEFSAGLSANSFSATVEMDHRPVGVFAMQEQIAQALL